MTKHFNIGDWVNVPGMADEVEVTGYDRGHDYLIVRHVLDNGRDAYKTVSPQGVTLFVDEVAA